MNFVFYSKYIYTYFYIILPFNCLFQIVNGGSGMGFVSMPYGSEWKHARKALTKAVKPYGDGIPAFENRLADIVQELGQTLQNKNGQPFEDIQDILYQTIASSIWLMVNPL